MTILHIKALKHYTQVLQEAQRRPGATLAHYTKVLEESRS